MKAIVLLVILNLGNIAYADVCKQKTMYLEQKKVVVSDCGKTWTKFVYNEKNLLIYFETSEGYWSIWTHDKKGRLVYYENTEGYAEKYIYKNGRLHIYMNNAGWYCLFVYDKNGKIKYWIDQYGKKRNY